MTYNHFSSNTSSTAQNSYTILGIESSCDETALAVICGNQDNKPQILAENLFSQTQSHAPYGGVVPEIAARAHAQKIPFLLDDIIKQAKINYHDLDAVAVTSEPGLIGGVLVGLMVAKGICVAHDKPLICVNHLEGHALSPMITEDISFPYLLLLTSGGHCQILIIYAVGQYELLGTTIDDSAGEAFDKVAKMLDLGFPGGPIVEQCAKTGNPKAYPFPRPLCNLAEPNFSFSGLKTAVMRIVDNKADKSDICASFQAAVADCFTNRMQIAMDLFKEKTQLETAPCVIAGGVAANLYLREHLSNLCVKNNFDFFAPPLKYCTDNGVMIAYAGLQRFIKGDRSPLDYKALARSSLGEN